MGILVISITIHVLGVRELDYTGAGHHLSKFPLLLLTCGFHSNPDAPCPCRFMNWFMNCDWGEVENITTVAHVSASEPEKCLHENRHIENQ